MGESTGHPFRGNQWVSGGSWVEGGRNTSREERGQKLHSLGPAVKVIHEVLDANEALFKRASIVGSWAEQSLTKMPDRAGAGTSDIDLMVEPADVSAKQAAAGEARSFHHWDALAKIEKEVAKRTGRRVQTNLEPVVGGAPHIVIWRR